MRVLLIFSILFIMYYGNLNATGGGDVSHSIEKVQENRESGNVTYFHINYDGFTSDYRLTGKITAAGNMPGNHYFVSDFMHNYVSDYILISQYNTFNSLQLNHNHTSDNFLFDLKTGLVTDLNSRPELFAGYFQQDNPPDAGKKPPSIKRPVVKNIIPAIAGLAYVSFIFDEQVNSFTRDNQTSFLKSVAHYTDMGGEKTIVVPGILLTYGTARFLLKNEKLQTTSLNAIQSVIVAAIATESVKNLAGRARPFTNEGAYTLNPFPGFSDQYKSFPSGHASLAFSLFTPFAETYSRWIYLVPVSVAAGRVYQDKHWLSDVVTGGGIGLISGLLFTHYENITIIPNGLRIYF